MKWEPVKAYRNIEWARVVLHNTQHYLENEPNQATRDLVACVGVQGAIAALNWVLGVPEDRARVQEMLDALREQLQQAGYLILPEPQGRKS